MDMYHHHFHTLSSPYFIIFDKSHHFCFNHRVKVSFVLLFQVVILSGIRISTLFCISSLKEKISLKSWYASSKIGIVRNQPTHLRAKRRDNRTFSLEQGFSLMAELAASTPWAFLAGHTPPFFENYANI